MKAFACALLASAVALSGCANTAFMAGAAGFGQRYTGTSPPTEQRVVAYRTGQQNFGTSVTGLAAISCEYRYGGATFWRTFVGYQCPQSVETQ